MHPCRVCLSVDHRVDRDAPYRPISWGRLGWEGLAGLMLSRWVDMHWDPVFSPPPQSPLGTLLFTRSAVIVTLYCSITPNCRYGLPWTEQWSVPCL